MAADLARRALLTSAVGVGALFAGSEAEAGTGGGEEWPPAEGLDRLVADERELLGARWLRAPHAAPDGWDADALLGRSMATLLWTGHLREPPPPGRKLDRLHGHGRARLGAMADVVYAHALHLDAMSAVDFRALDHLLAQDAAEDAEHSGFLYDRAAVRMPSWALLACRRVHADVLWRFRQHGSEAVSRELVAKVDRAARHHQFDWREAAITASDLPFEEQARSADAADDALVLSTRRSRRDQKLLEKYGPDSAALRAWAKKKNTAGGIALGVGILWMAGPQIVFGGICFGPPLIIAGAISLGKAGRLTRIAEEVAR